jgi:hypothetical protein
MFSGGAGVRRVTGKHKHGLPLCLQLDRLYLTATSRNRNKGGFSGRLVGALQLGLCAVVFTFVSDQRFSYLDFGILIIVECRDVSQELLIFAEFEGCVPEFSTNTCKAL